MGRWVVAVVLLALLGVAAAGSWYIWQQMDDVEIGTHGWIALGLGGGLSLLMTVLFMVLTIVSRRHGYDDEAGNP